MSDADKSVRIAAVEALGRLHDPRGVQPLILTMTCSEHNLAQAAASRLGKLVDGLTEVGDLTVELLLKVLATNDRYFQKAAIGGLISLRDARAVQPLIGVLGSNHQDVRVVPPKHWGGYEIPALRPLIDALADDSDDVREAVSESLGDLGDARAANALIQGLKDGHYRVNNAIVKASGCLGDRRCVEPLLRLAEKQWYDEVLIYSVVARLGDSRRGRTTN